ncbi:MULTISPECIES: GntR family transcriptional regulator [unclassified Salinibacterium]|uniref:GntR family transcriptional regulator n=1 Tax=unclassified Salinibacterium TaxID=2632331 RepID=UPI001420675D|nr:MULTISPECIES: GntR family transcriptional regulator [unclassified Salinibacterium]
MTEPMQSGAELFHTRKFSDIAGEIIRERIMSGALAPGARINEVVLADELKISRPPLREALRVLSGEGIVVIVPGKGAFVADLDLESFVHVAEVRLALEVETARLAAQRIERDDVAVIEDLMAQLETALAGQASAYPHHIEFHHALAVATGNPHLTTALGEVIRQIRLASIQTNEDPQRAHQVIIEHRVIAEAVLAGDADAAADAMRTHIRNNTEATVELLRKSERAQSS